MMLLALQNRSASKIQTLTKAYLLKRELRDRVNATFMRRTKACNVVVKNIRLYTLLKMLRIRCQAMAERLILRRAIFEAATSIQRGLSHKHREYYLPLRLAARLLNYFHYLHIVSEAIIYGKSAVLGVEFSCGDDVSGRLPSAL